MQSTGLDSGLSNVISSILIVQLLIKASLLHTSGFPGKVKLLDRIFLLERVGERTIQRNNVTEGKGNNNVPYRIY